MEKTCAKCGELKPISEFYRDSKSASGFTSYCKSCKGIKQVERFVLPAIDPSEWLAVFCRQVTCLRCEGNTRLSLYLEGKAQIPASVDDAKAIACLGIVLCRDCASSSAALTLTQRLRAKNRLNMVEERINEADYLIEQQMQLGKNAFLREQKRDGDIEAVVHDSIVDKFTKRRLGKEAQDELNERLPIITESKAKTIRSREPASYDFLFECEVI